VPHGPTIKSCVLEGHNDDGIALHGSYSVVVDAAADGSGGLQLCVTQADYRPGNLIKIYDKDFLFATTLRVTAVSNASPAGR